MSSMGALILFICFIGPVLPPIIGTVVGWVWDRVHAEKEDVNDRARREMAERRSALRDAPVSE